MTYIKRLRRLAVGAVLGLSIGSAGAQSPSEGVEDFSQNGLVIATGKHLGATAESMAEIIDTIFNRYGAPAAVIQGEEAAAAVVVGFRYGRGGLTMSDGTKREVYWRGPSVGIDTGGNAAKTFILVYGLDAADDIHRRFSGIEGTAFYVGGVAINYLSAGDTVLVPIRVGVGVRLGANVGYLKFTKESGWFPF